MIKEDYCSYEVSKLLKEKGFLFMCNVVSLWVDKQGKPKLHNSFAPVTWVNEDNAPCVTQALAMKWLRDVHNLCISPYAAAYRYGFTIYKCDTGSNICNDDVINEELTNYEDAVDAALKYCLTELI